MIIQRLHHAQITIPEGTEDEGRTFYCTCLGLTEIDKPVELQGRGGFWLQVGDQQLHVGTEEGVHRTLTKAHLAYQVSGLEEWKSHLIAEGITILDSVPIPGFNRFEIRDPFGNRVEFIEPII